MKSFHEENQRVDKDRQAFEPSGGRESRDRRLIARLLAVDALFEAARAGERGEPFGRAIEAWIDWFMSDGELKEEGAGQDPQPDLPAALQDP